MQDKPTLKKIAEEYLHALPIEPPSGLESTEPKDEKKAWLNVPPLNNYDKTKLTFAQLSESEKLEEDLSKEEPVLDPYAWSDLHLIRGHESTPDQHMLQRINRTTTKAGECVLATELVNPTKNYATIENKQQITQRLLENSQIAEDIEKELQKIQKSETKRAHLWQENNPLIHPEYAKNLDTFFGFYIRFGRRSKHKLTLWNYNKKSPGSLFFGKMLQDFFAMFFLPILWILTFYFQYNYDVSMRSIMVTSIVIGTVFYIGMYWFFYIRPYYINRSSTIEFLSGWLESWQIFWHSAIKINHIVANDPTLEHLYGQHLVKTRELLAESKKKTELGQLIAYLQKLPLANWSYFFSHTGKLLVAYQLLQEHQETFGDAVYEMGQVDVRLSIAKLIQESKAYSQKNNYILSTPLESNTATLPKVDAKEIWHIGLDAKKAIENDWLMNAETGPRMIIITGPNTGGKTTYILTAAMNVLLSQVFGIAAAKSFKHHIFYKIMTYVNPNQNLAQGLSLAEASFEVLKGQTKTLKKTKGPILMIKDEIFRGIDPDVAVEIGLELLEARLKKYTQCLIFLTTHYKPLTKLDKLPGVINKKVEVIIPGQIAPFDPTYKIVDGVATDDQNIVRATLTYKGVLEDLE